MKQPFDPSFTPVTSKWLSNLRFALILLSFGAVLVMMLFYLVQLFQDPQKKPASSLEARNQERSSSPIPAQAAKQPSQPQTTLSRIGKVEAARQSKPAGPLYDPRSSDVALSFESIPLDDPQVAEAQTVLTKYLQAATWRERLPCVFEPERAETLMQEQYDKRGETDPEHGELLAAGFITAGTSKVLNLQFASAARPDAGMRANFHRNRNGQMLLDWESWVAWSEKSWAALKKDRAPLPAVMRAVASESSYYNYEFGEDWRWLAVKLRSPDGLHSVTGYVPRDGILAVALGNLIGVPVPAGIKEGTPIPPLRKSGSKSLVTVRVAFPLNSQSDHCVKIIDLLADRWLLFPTERQ